MFFMHAERRQIFVVRQVTQSPSLSVVERDATPLNKSSNYSSQKKIVQGVTSVLLFLKITFSSLLDAGTLSETQICICLLQIAAQSRTKTYGDNVRTATTALLLTFPTSATAKNPGKRNKQESIYIYMHLRQSNEEGVKTASSSASTATTRNCSTGISQNVLMRSSRRVRCMSRSRRHITCAAPPRLKRPGLCFRYYRNIPSPSHLLIGSPREVSVKWRLHFHNRFCGRR